MVVDTLDNLEKYTSLNPLFAQAIEYLKSISDRYSNKRKLKILFRQPHAI